MDKKLMDRLSKYYHTIAIREGVQKIAVGLFFISENKVFTINGDVLKNSETLDYAIETLAKEHNIENLELLMLIDRVKEMVDGEEVYRLNFAASGELQSNFVNQNELPVQVQKTLKTFWKKRNNLK